MQHAASAWAWLLLLTLSVAGDALRLAASPVLPPSAATTPAPAPALSMAPPTPGDILAARRLVVPVQGIPRGKLRDTFDDARSRGRNHKAIDILAPHGTPVLAADDGRLEKLSRNAGGGIAIYQSDPTGRFVYYYCHLAGYAEGVREGQAVRRGQVIGYVGTTGNAPKTAPHLHFAVLQLTRKGRWWGGEALNPFAALAREDDVVAGVR